MKTDRGGIVVASGADSNKRLPLNGQRNAAPIVRFSFALVIVAACVGSCCSQVKNDCNFGVVQSKTVPESRSYIGGLFSAHRLADPLQEPVDGGASGGGGGGASGGGGGASGSGSSDDVGPTTGDVGELPVCATTFVDEGIMIKDRLHRYGVEQVEALLLAIDQIKQESSNLPWSPEYLVYDSCGDIQSGLDCVTKQAEELGRARRSAFATVVGPYYLPPDAVTPSQTRIDGVYNAAGGPDIKGFYSGVMSLLDEPHSLIDTTSEDRPYLLSHQVVFMEASCEIQARAAVDIINRLGWQEVEVVISGDNCGHESFETFQRTITEMDLSCVIRPTYHIPPKTTKKRAAANFPGDAAELWERLNSGEDSPTAIVLLSSITYAYDVLDEYKSLYDNAELNSTYSFLVGDCWGSPREADDLYQLMQDVAERAQSLVTLRTVTEGWDKFQNHMTSIRANSSEIKRNSFLREYWEEYFKCSIADETCDENERLPAIERPILRNYKAPLVIDSVYLAVAYGRSDSTNTNRNFQSFKGIFADGKITNVTSWTGNRVQLGEFAVRPNSYYRVPVTWSYDVFTWTSLLTDDNSTSTPPSSTATNNSPQTPTPSSSSNVTTNNGSTPTLASSINATSPSTQAPTTQSASEPNATASNAAISTQAAPTLATSNMTNNSTPTLLSSNTTATNDSTQSPPPSSPPSSSPSPPPSSSPSPSPPSSPSPPPPKELVRYGVWTYTIKNRIMTSSVIPDPKFASSIRTPVKRLSKHDLCPTTLPPTTEIAQSQTPSLPPQLCAPSDILGSITVPILLMIFHLSLVGMSIFNLGFTDLRKKISLFPFVLFVTLTFVSILLSLLISVDAFSAFECTSNIAVDFVINFFTVICVAVLFIEVLAHLANGMLNRIPVKIFLIGLIILIELIVSGVASFNVNSAQTESMSDDGNSSTAANSSTPPPFNPADPEGCLDARSRPIVAFSYWFLIIFVVASVVVLWITHVKGYQSRLKRRSIVDLFIVSILAVFYLVSVCLVVWAPNCKMQAGFLVVLAAFPAMITLFIGSVMSRRKYLEMKGLPITITGKMMMMIGKENRIVDTYI